MADKLMGELMNQLISQLTHDVAPPGSTINITATNSYYKQLYTVVITTHK